MSDDRLHDLVTEGANSHSQDIDLLTTEQMLQVFNDEDRSVPQAVKRALPSIAEAVDAISRRLRRGGNLHYFGAGTSGRLGILDASECYPTFGIARERVQGHMAGGPLAVIESKEGAEDDAELGQRDVETANLRTEDAVVAITASGRTPYCLGVSEAARRRGALTIGVTCNAPSRISEVTDVCIAALVGPEVLAGSTRLKAGTAQKMILNMISTGVMVRLGYTYGNLMVGVKATNEKLRARAAHLVRRITGKDTGVTEALARCDFDVRIASVMLSRGLSPEEARERLAGTEGSLRRAL